MKTVATVRRSGHYTFVDVITDGRRVSHWKVDSQGDDAVAKASRWLSERGWAVASSFAADGVTVFDLAL